MNRIISTLGAIATCKLAVLVSQVAKQGRAGYLAMSHSAIGFVTPLALRALSRHTGGVSLTDEKPSSQQPFARRLPSPIEQMHLLCLLLPFLVFVGGICQGQDALPISSQPTVVFSAAGYRYGEDGLPLAAQVTLVRNSAAGDTTVNVSFPGSGTATAGSDYDSIPVAVTFNGNELTKTIEIHLTQDNIVELDETCDLMLSAVSNATIGTQNSATVTIINDDSATISIDDVSMAEGNGTGQTYFKFTVSLSQPVDIPIRFTPKISSSDPTETLIAFWEGNAFGQASPLTHTIWVGVGQDSIVELDEQFLVTLGYLESFGRNITFLDNQGIGTILNDDQSVISVTGGDVIEGDSGTPKMVFTLTMSKEVDVPVTALIVSVSGGATDGVDFRSKSSRVTVTTSGTRFEIDIIPDNLAESTEYIITVLQKRLVEASGRDVILRNGVNGFIFNYGIRDDDFSPISYDDGTYQGVEGDILTINSSLGVLANDTDQDDGNGPAHLSAIVKSPPTHGKLVLDINGGFRYTPAPNFFGADSFTYVASDGTNQSLVKTVRINVTEQIDLAVGVDLLQSVLVAGGEALEVFRVSVTNKGPSDATGVKLNQNTVFPAHVNIISATPTAGTFSGGVWSLDLKENATATLTVTVQAESTAVGGSNVIPFGFSVSASNQPEVNSTNNMAVASASIINAADTNAAITASPKIDRQSGLLVSKVTVTNHGSVQIPAFRLYVRNLPRDIRVYNAHGIRTYGTPPIELPYLLLNRPLSAGASITLTIEFFRPSLDSRFTPQYEIELLRVSETEPTSASSGIPVTRNQMLSNRDYLIEIASIPGAVYAVEYSHDLAVWTRVVPTITAPANRLQWIDNGPPKTTSHPSAVPNRYYRFVLISNSLQ
ncbi:MAG: Calx-beta domain-containing protein [Luteolibacter sp.]